MLKINHRRMSRSFYTEDDIQWKKKVNFSSKKNEEIQFRSNSESQRMTRNNKNGMQNNRVLNK